MCPICLGNMLEGRLLCLPGSWAAVLDSTFLYLEENEK